MLVEVGLEGEGLVAQVALVVLVPGVRLHVRAQVGAVSKRLATVRTAVGFLPRVGAEVTLQQPGPGEQLAANPARMRQLVRQQVHGQGRHADVRLAACVALLSGLGV